jgi:acetyl esterase/lipase
MTISLDMPFGELFSQEPFRSAQELIIPLRGVTFDDVKDRSVRDVMTKMLGWVPPHALESLGFIQKENEKRPIYFPYPNHGGSGAFYFGAPAAKGVAFLFPGGGYYSVCALAEGYPFAQRLTKRGYDAVVVGYRTAEQAFYPHVVEDAACAIRKVYQGKAFGRIPSTSLMIGFSAGGHLAGVMASKPEGYGRYGYPRPDTLILAYPVSSFVLPTHGDTRDFFLGEHREDESWRARFSLENLVGPEFPKTYCWGCSQDPCVPPEGPDALERALQRNQVPYDRKVYAAQAHGWGLGEGTPAEGWLEKAIAFHEGRSL